MFSRWNKLFLIKDIETTGAALTFSQRGVSTSIPSLLSAFLRGSPAFQSSSVFSLQERGNLTATKQRSMWCSFSLDTSCSYHRHIYESVQLHLPHLLCNALVASSAFQSIKKILSGKERIRLSCGSMLCRACLHYWWIPWWPRHICGSISIISISVISLLPNGVMRPRDSRSTMDSSILRRRRGLIQRTWAQYIINFPPTTFSTVISYYHS